MMKPKKQQTKYPKKTKNNYYTFTDAITRECKYGGVFSYGTQTTIKKFGNGLFETKNLDDSI